jgi:ABC-type polysaccharide/polyol phosphate transport system ATPase subunit
MAGRRATTLKAAVLGVFQRAPKDRFQALRDVSFEVHQGETVGIIGTNGSGKSTVLKLITGIIKPTAGQVTVRGRMSPLIELGAGFHPEFTGRENVFLNGAILGVPKKRLQAAFDDIVAFSEIGAFIDQPVKTYSSGMYTRLAFSIAIHVDPDILVVDEVLAVGDEAFQRKCLQRVHAFREAGKTILLVAHSQQQIAEVCDRVIWLDKGAVRMDGPPAEVLAAYANRNQAPVESLT